MSEQGAKPEISDDDWSKATKRRIGKEVSKRKRADEIAQNATREAKELREENKRMQEQLDKLESDRFELVKKENKEKLKQAIEDGDTDKQSELLSDIASETSKNEEIAKRRMAREKEKEAPVIEDEPVSEDTGKEQEMHPSARDFLDRNKDWINSNEDAYKRAVEIERELKEKEGYDMGDDLYSELEERIFKEMPDLTGEQEVEMESTDDIDIDAYSEKETESASPHNSPVAPISRGDGRRRGKRSRQGAMTKAARDTMMRYGLNPDDPDQIKGFLKHRKGA